MTLSIQIAKFKVCQYQMRATLPNLMFTEVTHYIVFGLYLRLISSSLHITFLWIEGDIHICAVHRFPIPLIYNCGSVHMCYNHSQFTVGLGD